MASWFTTLTSALTDFVDLDAQNRRAKEKFSQANPETSDLEKEKEKEKSREMEEVNDGRGQNKEKAMEKPKEGKEVLLENLAVAKEEVAGILSSSFLFLSLFYFLSITLSSKNYYQVFTRIIARHSPFHRGIMFRRLTVSFQRFSQMWEILLNPPLKRKRDSSKKKSVSIIISALHNSFN